MPASPTLPLLIVLLSLLLAAAVTDARSGLIPNALTLPVVVLAPSAHLIMGGPGALWQSLLGGLVCAAVPLWLFSRGAMGGGDVKLFGAVGLLSGAAFGLQLQWLCYLAALAVHVLLRWACGPLRWRCEQRPGRLVAGSPAPVAAEACAGIRLGPAALLAGCGMLLWEALFWLH